MQTVQSVSLLGCPSDTRPKTNLEAWRRHHSRSLIGSSKFSSLRVIWWWRTDSCVHTVFPYVLPSPCSFVRPSVCLALCPVPTEHCTALILAVDATHTRSRPKYCSQGQCHWGRNVIIVSAHFSSWKIHRFVQTKTRVTPVPCHYANMYNAAAKTRPFLHNRATIFESVTHMVTGQTATGQNASNTKCYKRVNISSLD